MIVDGVKLDTTSTRRTLRAACETLGLPSSGGKKKCLSRVWGHLQAQELIAAHGAQQQLRGEFCRPANAQFVPDARTEKEIAAPAMCTVV